MDTILQALRWVHIPFGLAGLAVFWVPLVLKKGSLWHRRVGWVFVVCMGVASITAGMLAVLRLLIAARDKGGIGSLALADFTGPVFLFNVALLTFTSVHHGLAVLRQKKIAQPPGPLLPIVLPVALVALSLGSLALGAATGNVVLFTLPVVGLLVGSQYLWTLLRARTDPMFWWYQHMSGMLGGCIAAITAATITNARHIRPYAPLPQWVFWIAPAALGLPLLILWTNAYRRKFNRSR